MSWFLIAIFGHLSNGAAFLIDKILLNNAFKRSATYAGLVGLLSFLAVVATPWVEAWPRGETLLLAVFSGLTFVFALWTFFAALARAEASRVVPIVGALIPLLTLLGTSVFLDERLTSVQLAGFAALVLSTIILSSSGGPARPTATALLLALSSALLFAVGSVTAKAAYDAAGFLSGFVTTRIAAGAAALCVIAFFDPLSGREIAAMASNKERSGSASKKAVGALLFGQTLGAAGFVFVQYATALGSAAIVNALQAVQYAFLVAAGFAFKRLAPHLLKEKTDGRTIAIKLFALALTAAGLILVTL